MQRFPHGAGLVLLKKLWKYRGPHPLRWRANPAGGQHPAWLRHLAPVVVRPSVLELAEGQERNAVELDHGRKQPRVATNQCKIKGRARHIVSPEIWYPALGSKDRIHSDTKGGLVPPRGPHDTNPGHEHPIFRRCV